jgi:hypothetical protein
MMSSKQAPQTERIAGIPYGCTPRQSSGRNHQAEAAVASARSVAAASSVRRAASRANLVTALALGSSSPSS